MEPTCSEYDAIVVGSGPGGASVARDLSCQGEKVLILEWGDNNPVRGKVAQMVQRAAVPGKSLYVTGQMISLIRAITTGGSSVIYCATAFDPPVDMLKSHGVDISEEAAEVQKSVPIGPLRDELMADGPKAFLKSALDLGYNAHRLNKFIYQEHCRARCELCFYGCPHGAKWNARNLVSEALANGAEMINFAKAEKVLIENNKAVGVAYRQRRKTCRAYASKIIIAAGGIGSPLILRNSGIPGTGRNFFFDPLVYVYGKIKGLGNGKSVPMSAGVHFPEDGIVMTDFNMPYLMKIFFDLEVVKIKQALDYHDVLPIMIKIRDDLGGEITPRGWVNKTLSRPDKLRLEKGADHARRILAHAGATDIYRGWYFAAHPGGTVKIGEHVDTNLKTMFDNLYVCDCSVIPEEWGLPPTWTLLALGKRLAKHLTVKDRIDSRPAAAI
jgi:choline dehydrogenase-like flavoprotein